MSERPAKLPAIALGVLWACPQLTLGEVVVCYHDWALDQGGADGAYISHESLSARLGGKLTPATISRIRQRLKRLTLHEPIRRRDARNLGWVLTLPRQCVPRTYHEIPALAIALGEHLRKLTAWSEQDGRESPAEVDSTVQPDQTAASTRRAAALGGRGESSASASVRQAQFPSAVREKGVAARAAKTRRDKEEPLSGEEMRYFLDGIARDEREGKITPDQAALMRRVSGL